MMTNGDLEGQIFFYPTLTRIMDSFSRSLTTVFIYLFILNNLPEVPEYSYMPFHIMTLFDVLGNIACSIPG